MEFGFARFLEMFEERFGRTVTTAVLALVGTAVAIYSAKVIIETIVYVFRLVRSANLLTALSQESVASHIIVFAVQIVLTFLSLGFIWQQIRRRRLRDARARQQVADAKGIEFLRKRNQEFDGLKKVLEEVSDNEVFIRKIDSIIASQERVIAALEKEQPAKT